MMASIIRWLHERCEKVRKVRLETWLSYLAILVLISPFIPVVRKIWLYETQWNGDATRSIILTLGGIGAFYGLVLAARRLDINQQQASTSEANLFNDRLARGVDGLSFDNSPSVRLANARFLKDLAIRLDFEDADRQNVIELLSVFLRDLALFRASPAPGQSAEISQEIVLKVEENQTLMGLLTCIAELVPRVIETPYYDHSAQKLIGLPRQQLLLANLDFSQLHFNQTEMGVFHFMNCDFSSSSFVNATLYKGDFHEAEFIGSKFILSDLRECQMNEANFALAEFGPRFDAVDLPSDISGCVFEGAKNLTQNQIDLAIYEAGSPPISLPLDANTGRQIIVNPQMAYVWQDNVRYLPNGKALERERPWWSRLPTY